jgi:hypothetical protein
MSGYFKGSLFLATVALLVCFCSCSERASEESDFKKFFSDLSVGAPQYQKLHKFFRPADVIKGDYCEMDFSQSEIQFRAFAARLGVQPEKILSSSNVWVRADSKINPGNPWTLRVEAHTSSSATNIYEVHVDGRQPYN